MDAYTYFFMFITQFLSFSIGIIPLRDFRLDSECLAKGLPLIFLLYV